MRTAIRLHAILLCGCFSEAPTVQNTPGSTSGGETTSGGPEQTGGETGTDTGSNTGTVGTTSHETTGGETTPDDTTADVTGREDTGTGDTGTGDTGTDDTGTDDTGTDGTGTDDTGTDDTGANDCTCVAAVPVGWEGPFAAVEGACPRSYPDPDAAPPLYRELDAPDAECDCTCGAVTGSCVSVALKHYEDSQCTEIFPGDPPTVDAGECIDNAEAVADNRYAALDPHPPMNVSCEPELSSILIPDVSWAVNVTLCHGAEVSSCEGDEICVPSDTDACITASGEQDCPDAYPQRTVVYEDVDDTRACECECGEDGVSCSVNATGHPDTLCSGAAAVFDENSCIAPLDAATSILIEDLSIGGSCEPNATAIGEAVPATPTTICCSS